MSNVPLPGLLASVLVLTACRATPTADAVLAGEAVTSAETVLDPMDLAVGSADALARRALDAARADDATPEAWLAAARALFAAADLRIQAAILERFGDGAPVRPGALIDADDTLSADLRGDVAGLCREARSAARSALDAAPAADAELRLEARLIDALGDALHAWAEGPSRALLGGAAGRIPGKLETLAAEAPELEGAAPLRLRGRFLRRAPWPARDRVTGRMLLERAVDLAPTPLNLMFLGDAQWVDGDEDLARTSWGRATDAEADPLTAAAAPLVRRLTALRLAGLARPMHGLVPPVRAMSVVARKTSE